GGADRRRGARGAGVRAALQAALDARAAAGPGRRVHALLHQYGPDLLDHCRLRDPAGAAVEARLAGAAEVRGGAGAPHPTAAGRGGAGPRRSGPAAGRAQAGHRRRAGRGAGDRGHSQIRGREGARDPARQGTPGVRAAARPGAQGDRCREGEGDPRAAARGRGPLDRGRVEADRGEPRLRGESPPGDGVPGEPRGRAGAGAVKSTTVARNYAQALLLAAEAHDMGVVERYGQLMEAVAGAVQADERIAVALESPRVSKALKAALLERALGDLAPAEFVRFLQAVMRRGRQGLLGEIAQQYDTLVDVKLNRVHAGVTLLDAPDARLEKQVVERLSQAIGKEVRAHFRADRGILGGVVVRVGDRIYDGSVRRKLATLRRKLVSGE